MSSILITFEVTEKQSELRNSLMKLGYLDRWFFNNKTYLLPVSTLWKTDTTPEKSINEIRKITQELNIKLEHAIAVPSSPWAGISSGSSFSTDKNREC